MTAIQQFWVVAIPTILTSNLYPVIQKDESVLASSVSLQGGLIRPTVLPDDHTLQGTTTIVAGQRVSTAVFNSQSDFSNGVQNAVIIVGGARLNTAVFNTQTDESNGVQSSTTIVAGTRAVTAVFNAQADESNGLRATTTIIAGSRV